MKKLYILLLICLLTLSGCSGCGKEKPTAADSVKAIYNLYILGNYTDTDKLRMTEEDISNAIDAYNNSLANTIRSNFSASGLEITNETIDTICQTRKEALAKMKANFTLISEEGDTAIVSLSTTYFDEATLDSNAAYNAREQADRQGFTDYNEYLAFVMEAYTQNLIEGYKNVVPSSDTKEILVPCIIINNTWLPKDMAAFGSELGLTIAGQN